MRTLRNKTYLGKIVWKEVVNDGVHEAIVDEKLLQEAVIKLKKLPFEYKDPTDSIAVELVLDSYRLGYFKQDDLTNVGCDLVRQGKYRGHQQLTNNRGYQSRVTRNRYSLNTA